MSSKSRSRAKSKTLPNRWLMTAAAAVVLVTVLVLASGSLNPQSVPATKGTLPLEISVSQAATMRDQGAFILDVRQPEEWDAVHIQNATLIPLGELPSRLSEVPRDRDVVVVCRSGNRSQSGRDILLQAGFTQVTSMAGGMNDWAASGYATVSGP
jgi:rhodanese-related sulfurtransferase